ncbi:mitochondrial editing factor 9 [Actinidia rufa]|uniref:Mitochondrial editing factor 9 n=1 Tax=Actinidia rufa TaxID=165716 RepID=A0A7J0DGG1_9ERIC|nr:mitochondrial editing factor 9 [Actinidia rufa]
MLTEEELMMLDAFFDQIPFYPDCRRGHGGRFARDVVSWNSMIMCYVKAGEIFSAQELFDQMVERDNFSWNTMISGCVNISDMEEASNLFCKMPDPDTLSWNLMISGFVQMGNLELACDFFRRMPQKNLASWSSMILGYGQIGDCEGAVKLFIQMQAKGEKPDGHTFSSILSVCAESVALHLGMQIHQQVIKAIITDAPLNNSLITMYARCGAIIQARAIFDEMKSQKDVISWNAMIGGYASHGFAAEALELFGVMKRLKVRPTYITFISVLKACSHAGLVEEGRMHFRFMVSEFGIEARVEHYASLVDIVGRHGKIEEAMAVINSMPFEPDKAVWGALLGACRVHNNVELAGVAAEALMRLEPESSAPYVVLHNMYANFGRWDDATEPADYYGHPHFIGDEHVSITDLAFSDQSELLVSYSNEFIYPFTRDMGLGPDPDPASPVSMGSVAGEVGSELQSAASLSDMDEDVKVGPRVFKGHRNSETVKGVNFGPKCEYVVSGSDCGRISFGRRREGSSSCYRSGQVCALDRATLPTNIEKDYDDAVDSNGFSGDNSDDGDDENGDGDCNDDDGNGHDDSSDGLSCDGCNDSFCDSSTETYRKKLGAPQGFILVITAKADDKITGQWRESYLRARGARSYLDI